MSTLTLSILICIHYDYNVYIYIYIFIYLYLYLYTYSMYIYMRTWVFPETEPPRTIEWHPDVKNVECCDDFGVSQF